MVRDVRDRIAVSAAGKAWATEEHEGMTGGQQHEHQW